MLHVILRPALGITVAVLAAFPVAASSAPAMAAVTCPTVDPQTGLLTPAPSPGVDWSGCDLHNAFVRGSLAGANLSNANLTNAFLDVVDLTSANLDGANLSQALLDSVNMTTASLNAANLAHASLNTDNLTGASLSATTTLTAISSRALTGQPAQLPPGWQVASGYLVGPTANLDGANLAGASLVDAHLANATLITANLTGADLSGADLTSANLQRARLSNAILADANLTSADASAAVLTGVNVSNATLTGATLTGAPSGAVTGKPLALPLNWSLLGGYFMGPFANLKNANLSNLSLGPADLNGATVAGANLSQTDMTNADLTDIVSGAITGQPLLPADWTVRGGYLIGPTTDLAGQSLTGIDLSQADLANAELYGANLTSANLTQANLTSANLSSATLTSANLSQAVMSSAQLGGVQSGGITQAPASLPQSWSLLNGYLVGPGANLLMASLPGVNLAGADLALTNFGAANLSSANLAGADLNNANFGGADLSSADLSNASLNAADLGGANLTGADAVGAAISGNLFTANLTRANLTNANLSSWNMSGVILADTDLTGARLGEVIFYSGGSGTPKALPTHWAAADGFLFGPGVGIYNAAMKGIDLHGDDLVGATLYNDDLTNADLDHANLSSAELFGSSMAGVSVVGTIWLNTICPDGTNSNRYVHGCFSPLDTTPPIVTITGIRNGAEYVIGKVPAARCQTTDDGTVATPAQRTITTTGKNGVGRFTVTCTGAVDLAGNGQRTAVRASYLVVYGMRGFSTPPAGATLSDEAGRITVSFRLTNSTGRAIAPSLAEALARAGRVRVTLRASRARPTSAACRWNGVRRLFECSIRLPSSVAAEQVSTATLTATEDVGTSFVTVPAVDRTHDPETIHFS